MKKILMSCFVIMVLSTAIFGSFAYFPIEKRVNNNNLIVIGILQNVSETETDEFRISKGTLQIESVIYGNFVNANHQKLQKGIQFDIEWSNSKMFACQFGFAENEKEIWFLNVDDEGKIESLTNNSSSSLDELLEVKKHLKKKGVDEVSKKIQLQNDVKESYLSDLIVQEETVKCLYSIKETKPKEYSPFSSLLVILASISLYFILYRSRFKIR